MKKITNLPTVIILLWILSIGLIYWKSDLKQNELLTQTKNNSKKLESVEDNQQQIMSSINYQTKRAKKIIEIRDFILRTNKNIFPALAYEIAEQNYDFAEKYQVDINMAIAIQAVETHFDYSSVSTAGAITIWQIMPANLRLICKAKSWDYNYKHFQERKYLSKQIESGYLWLSTLQSEYENIDDLLIAYNAGPKYVKIKKTHPNKLQDETKAFIPKVKRIYTSLS